MPDEEGAAAELQSDHPRPHEGPVAALTFRAAARGELDLEHVIIVAPSSPRTT